MLNKRNINYVLLISATISLVLTGAEASAMSVTGSPGISSEDYDKAKHCTSDLSKDPTSIEYLTLNLTAGMFQKSLMVKLLEILLWWLKKTRKYLFLMKGIYLMGGLSMGLYLVQL